MKFILLWTQLAFVWAKIVKHTNRHENDSSLQSESEVPLQIGYGYDTRTNMSKIRNCFKNADQQDSIKYRNWSQNLNFEQTISLEEISSLTNIEFSIGGSFHVFSASAAARYMTESIDSRYSMNFNYAQSFAADAIYDLPSGYGADILSVEAQDVLKAGSDNFIQYCGDGFVSSAKAGGVLLVTVGISFHTSTEKSLFSAEISGSVLGIGKISSAYSQASTKLNIDATLFVRALQLGGNTTSLANIFGKPDAQGNYPVINCNQTNIAACNQIIDGIIGYAENDFMSSFDLSRPDQMYNFGSHVEKFVDLGVPIQQKDFRPETIAAQKYIYDTYTEDKQSFDFLNAYMKSPLFKYWLDFNIGAFKTAVDEYQMALSAYGDYKVLSNCYDSHADETCVIVADKIKQLHEVVDAQKLVQRLRQVYYAITSEGLQLVFIPADAIPQLAPDNEIDGTFVVSHLATNTIGIGSCWLQLYKNPAPSPYRNPDYYGVCSQPKVDFMGSNFKIKRTNLYVDGVIFGGCGWDGHDCPALPDGGSCRLYKRTSWNDMPI